MRWRVCVTAFMMAVLLGGAVPSLAQVNVGTESAEPPAEFGILGGAGFQDKELNPVNEQGIGPLAGARVAYRLAPNIGWFGDYTWSGFKPREFAQYPFSGNVYVSSARTGFEFFFWKAFIAAGAGIMDVSFDSDKGEYRPGLGSVGLGLRWVVGHRWALRVEGRAERTWGDHNDRVLPYPPPAGQTQGEQVGAVATNFQALGGVSLLFLGQTKDSDHDGVPDKTDKCPDTPMGWMVDVRGCPLDSDNDGVPDGGDRCANTPTGALVDDRGCPLDSDNDHVPDGLDKCPGTPTGATVDANGCPTDADGDGVVDGLDACPNTPTGAVVDSKGCPMDSDGDGVPDGVDKCPGTAPGTQVDAKGCQVAIPMGKTPLKLQGVNFISGKATLTESSSAILDNVASSLQEHPEVRLEISGYTDAVGSDKANQKLSEARAETVKQYLVGKGIEASRLVAKGYGEANPVGDNATPEGRALNRRIELVRIQ